MIIFLMSFAPNSNVYILNLKNRNGKVQYLYCKKKYVVFFYRNGLVQISKLKTKGSTVFSKSRESAGHELLATSDPAGPNIWFHFWLKDLL